MTTPDEDRNGSTPPDGLSRGWRKTDGIGLCIRAAGYRLLWNRQQQVHRERGLQCEPSVETGRKYGPSNWSYRSGRPAVLTGQFDTSGRTRGLKRCPSTTGMQDRSTTSRALIGAIFPFTVVPACYLPVYASLRPLPGPRKTQYATAR